MANKKTTMFVFLNAFFVSYMLCATNDDPPSVTPENFLYAVQGRDIDKIKNYLLQEGYNINVADKNGNTALHLAADKSSKALVSLLLNAGIDANAKNKNNKTALVVAADKLAELVKQAQAAKDPAKITSHNVAYIQKLQAMRPYEDIIKLLLTRGAYVSDADFEYLKYLDGTTVKKLFINASDADGNTALMRAASKGLAAQVETLLLAGARTDMKNKNGKNALELAQIGFEQAQGKSAREKRLILQQYKRILDLLGFRAKL